MTDKFHRRQVIAGMGALTAGGLISSPAFGAPERPPNIIFIMADDLGFADLSCTGSHHIRTPAIDSLARNGVLFRQGYANSSICSPTRTALLTGQYQQRFRLGLEEPLGPNPANLGLPADVPTIASVLRKRGYYTKLVGKWHLGNPGTHGPRQHGYDDFLGIVEGAGDYFRHKVVVGGKELGPGLVEGDNPVRRNGYLTDLFGDEAAATINRVGKRRPFFISLHFTAPHWPWEGREDKAVSETLTDFFHYDGGSLATYKRMVEAMDDNVAKVLSALRSNGLLDNSIVVFTSDNGGERFSETWPFTGVKGELLEGGIRVPILAQWPGRIPAASRSEQVMISMDFLPTLLSCAGGNVASAGAFDGVDLSRQLRGAAAIERTLFWRFKANQQAAVRQGSWKYLRLGRKEHLFDLSTDERERADLKVKRKDKLTELVGLYDAWNAKMLPYPPESSSEQVKDNYADRY